MKEKAVVEKVYQRRNEVNLPTLLKFQNGSFAAIDKENTKFCFVKNENTKRRGALVTASGQVYHGEIADPSEKTEELTDTYICVRNKATSKVRIIPIEQARLNNNIYRKLQPVVPSMSKESTISTLLKQFGSRKSSRFITTKEQMNLDIDVIKSDLERTVTETDITAEEVKVDSQKYFDSIRPKCNKDAMKIDDLYDVGDVVPRELLGRLDEEVKSLYSTNLEQIPISSEYLRSCLEKLKKSPKSGEGSLNMKCIIYMDCLHNLISNKRNRSLAKAELSGITTKVESDVRERFSDPNGKKNMRTLYSTEKALCYFIVLAMLTSDKYQVGMKTLCRELNLPRKKIVQYAKVVFAHPKSPSSDMLTFRLPNQAAKGKKN